MEHIVSFLVSAEDVDSVLSENLHSAAMAIFAGYPEAVQPHGVLLVDVQELVLKHKLYELSAVEF